MKDREVGERLKRVGFTREILDPLWTVREHNRALFEQLRREREWRGMRWPKFDWVWEQPERPQAGYHVGPGDPDWPWRKFD